MKEVTGYRLTDGRIIENKTDAIKLQREIDFKKAIWDFAEREGAYEAKNSIYNAIVDNADELRKIFNQPKPTILTNDVKHNAIHLVADTFGSIEATLRNRNIVKKDVERYKIIDNLAKEIVKDNCKVVIKKLELEAYKQGTWFFNFTDVKKYWDDVISYIKTM